MGCVVCNLLYFHTVCDFEMPKLRDLTEVEEVRYIDLVGELCSDLAVNHPEYVSQINRIRRRWEMKKSKIKIEPTFLGIAKVIYDLEAVLEETIEGLESVPNVSPTIDEAIREAVARIEAATKALRSAPKKKIPKARMNRLSSEQTDAVLGEAKKLLNEPATPSEAEEWKKKDEQAAWDEQNKDAKETV